MHQQAYEWVSKTVSQIPVRRSVLEFGSRDVNGTARSVFSQADRYLGIDIIEDAGVDIVADASTFKAGDTFDTVLCMEVLEHTDKAREICRNAHAHLSKHGVFIATMAGIGRQPHSAVEGGELKEGEFYRNVSVAELRYWLSDFGLVMIVSDVPGDLYAVAIR